MSLKRFAVAGFLAAVLAAAVFFSGGCGDNGANNNNGGGGGTDTIPTPPGASLDAKLVGDWRLLSRIADGEETAEDGLIEVDTYKATGEMMISQFFNAGSFWIEDRDASDKPVCRTSRDTLYMTINFFGIDIEFPAKYAVSGGTLTTSTCTDGECMTSVWEKVELAAFKSALGTVYGIDPDLYISDDYIDLSWSLQDDEDMLLDFDQFEFYDGERYLGDDYNGRVVWYTVGSRLFLVGMNWNGEIEKTVELEYKITGAGSAARLSVRPVLPGGTFGPEDIWIPGEAGGGWDWDLYKSKPGKKPAKTRKGAFASSWQPKAAAK